LTQAALSSRQTRLPIELFYGLARKGIPNEMQVVAFACESCHQRTTTHF
jgi:hypothetical protein